MSRTSVLIISHITFRDWRVHSFCDNLSRSSCIQYRGTQRNDRMVPILKSGVSYGNFGRLESFWRVFPSSETVRGHGVAVLYTEILRRPSLIMMVIYLDKKKKKKDVKNAQYLIRIGLAVIQSCVSGTRKKVSRDSRTRNGVELARHRFEFSWMLKLFIWMHHLVTIGNLL